MINKRLFSASVCAGLLSIMIGCNALASAGSTSSSQSVVNGVIVKSISDNAISDKAISDNAEEPDAAGALNAGEAVETVAAVTENSGVSVMAASTEVSDNSSDNSSDSSPDNSSDSSPDNSPDSSPNNSSNSGSALDTSNPQTVAAPLIPPNCLLTGISSKRPTQPGLVRSPSLTAKSTRSRTPAFMSFPEPLPMRRSVSKRGKRTRSSLSSMVSKSPTTAYPVSMSKKRTRYSSLQQTRKTPSL